MVYAATGLFTCMLYALIILMHMAIADNIVVPVMSLLQNQFFHICHGGKMKYRTEPRMFYVMGLQKLLNSIMSHFIYKQYL